ncbi:ATP-dependent DNA helicase DinG [Paenibacillaceae bacterium GAS479]|nr:ATP-dependent DNA helicase DinG [Paenibacillaceae bacterium GAS479]
MPSLQKLPFQLSKGEDIKTRSQQWIGDAFYEKLPHLGFEIREEQIYAAFQIYKSLVKKEKLLVEAGLGCGKTFAYLIGAVLHARLTQRPVVISCGSNSLVEQLLHPGGDIVKLMEALNIQIDARAAFESNQYICARKVQLQKRFRTRKAGLKDLIKWAETTKLGCRLEVPSVGDELWSFVQWEEGQDCGDCSVEYRCPTRRAREHYRKATDIIVCTHSYFFRHIRTKEILKEQGNLPLLPSYSAIIFDEAHLLEDSARRSLGEVLTLNFLLKTFDRILARGIRQSFALLLEEVRVKSIEMFNYFEIQKPQPLQKTPLKMSEGLTACIKSLHLMMNDVSEQLAIEEGITNAQNKNQLIWASLSSAEQTFKLLLTENQDRDHAIWLERGMDKDDEIALWAAPSSVINVMQEQVLSGGLPVIFSSATLAQGSSFDYTQKILGLDDANSMQVESPYDYANQCLVYIPDKNKMDSHNDRSFQQLAQQIIELITVSNGCSLVLFRDVATMNSVRNKIKKIAVNAPWNLLWEGDASTSHLLTEFIEDVTSVLFGVTFWEGISVVGPSLSQCIITQLPFPMDDPIMMVKKQQANAAGLDPFEVVDLPVMLMKLKQGTGRLIRSASDRGVISCVDISFRGTNYEKEVLGTFPSGACFTSDLLRVPEIIDSLSINDNL